VTIGGVLFVYMLGGAVLIEKVFSWGGVGQYAVQAVGNSDYAAIQGFVLLAATFTVLVYLVVDLIQMALDPRVTH
jgi:peptide/nickel transport system permease protein